MSNEIEHTITLTIQELYWPGVAKALREGRVIHRDGGGTSRMVRSGETVTFTAKGPAATVLNTIEFVQKVGDMVAESQSKTVDRLTDRLMDRWRPNPEREEAKTREFAGMVADALSRMSE